MIERFYSASPKRVYAAWSDPVAKRSWFVEGEGWDIQSYDIDFREGGSEKSTYGFRRGEEMFGEKTAFSNETVFNEIMKTNASFSPTRWPVTVRASASRWRRSRSSGRQRLAPDLHRARRILRRRRQRHDARARLAGIARRSILGTEITPDAKSSSPRAIMAP